MAQPGVVVVWSGSAPRCEVHAIPPGAGGLVLGRETIAATDDDRISRSHVRLEIGNAHVIVTDLASRNGAFANGIKIDEPAVLYPPFAVRTGRTVAVVVPDVARYADAPRWHGHVLVGAATRAAWSRIEELVARPGARVAITGRPGIGKRTVARAFAARRGGSWVAFDPIASKLSLADVVGERDVATLVLSSPEAIGARDRAMLDAVIARPSVAIATVADMPHELRAELTGEVLTLPQLDERADEVGYLVEHLVRRVAPAAPIHATLVEAALILPWPFNLRDLADEIVAAIGRAGGGAVRGEYLMGGRRSIPEAVANGWCVVLPPRRRIRPP